MLMKSATHWKWLCLKFKLPTPAEQCQYMSCCEPAQPPHSSTEPDILNTAGPAQRPLVTQASLPLSMTPLAHHQATTHWHPWKGQWRQTNWHPCWQVQQCRHTCWWRTRPNRTWSWSESWCWCLRTWTSLTGSWSDSCQRRWRDQGWSWTAWDSPHCHLTWKGPVPYPESENSASWGLYVTYPCPPLPEVEGLGSQRSTYLSSTIPLWVSRILCTGSPWRWFWLCFWPLPHCPADGLAVHASVGWAGRGSSVCTVGTWRPPCDSWGA